jgi:4-amino-4-deoxy-L-arabinose transferase-like glycosyltransferase
VLRAIERRQARWLYAAGLVAGLNFDVKLFESLAVVPGLVVLYALAASAPLRRRIAHIAAAGGVFLVAALWWPVAVSLAPGPKPFAMGSTDGSVWNVIFIYNGLDRVHPAHPVAPPAPVATGLTRLFQTHLSIYGRFAGIELLAALVLGALALLVLARRPAGADPLKRAFLVFLALWLLPATLLFSAVGTLHLRYLEAISPPTAATIGIALTSLLAAAATRRLAAAAVVLGLVAVAAYTFTVPSRGGDDQLVSLVAAATAALVLAAVAARGERVKPALAVAGVLALVCVLAGPTSRSAIVVNAGQTDSGRPGFMPPDELRNLEAYVAPRTRGARYEVATAFYASAGPLIARDGRPVMVLTSVHNRPIVPVARLAEAVHRGQVRFLLMVGACGRKPLGSLTGCPPSWRWARAHSVDVSKQAGLPGRGLLFRFTQHQ